MAINKKVAVSCGVIITAVFLLASFHHKSPIHGAVSGTINNAVNKLYNDANKPRYIFVDLGANRADSLEAFLQHADAKFAYNFPTPSWATLDNAEIYLFEANPVFNTDLVKAKERYTSEGKKIQIFPSTVCDIIDGTRTFYLDTINTAQDYWGSSTYANHGDVVKSNSSGTELTAVNIARWLLMNTLPRDFVVVKMDLEGAEYNLLPHFAEMQAWSVIDHLLIEWHVSLPTPEAAKLAVQAADKLKAEGVIIPPYSSGA